MTGITGDADKLLGIFTDGDLRRALNEQTDIYHSRITAVMTCDPITVQPQMLAAEIVTIMQAK